MYFLFHQVKSFWFLHHSASMTCRVAFNLFKYPGYQASLAQRAGRAGRTGPGHCYRFYFSALFENHFDDFAQPEILRVPIDGVVLQMKSMNIDAVVNFLFPTPPNRASLKHAETILG